MDGGLLLLSRHRIVASGSTVYRQCSGDDCLSNKGVLHARVQRTGSPCPVDVFLTHTQAADPTIAGTVAGARVAVARRSDTWLPSSKPVGTLYPRRCYSVTSTLTLSLTPTSTSIWCKASGAQPTWRR